MITPIARFAVRYAVPVLVGWALVVVVFGLIGRGVEDKVQPSLLFIPGTESQRWREARAGSFNESLIVLLVGPRRELDRQGPALVAALAAPPADARDLAVERRREAAAGAAAEPARGGHQRRPADPARREHQHRRSAR